MSEAVRYDAIDRHTDWEEPLKGCGAVVHTAGWAHRPCATPADRTACREVNVLGAVRLFRSAQRAGVGRFVFLSSVGVYGNVSRRPLSETDATDPREYYAVTKLEAEETLRDARSEGDTELVIVRPPLVYGRNAPGNFGSLVAHLRRGLPVPAGTRGGKRSFVAIDNLVDFLHVCTVHPSAANETFVVTDGEDLTFGELLDVMAGVLDSRSLVLRLPNGVLRNALTLLGKGSVAQRLLAPLQLDMQKARDRLGWSPPLSLQQAMEAYLGPVA